MKTIAIAGASGFVGFALTHKLLKDTDCKIIALSRSERKSKSERLVWRKCDLFSRDEIFDALEGVDELIYLVHSMEPSARLDQASFADYDLILADNFGRCARELGINKVTYLGGIVPPDQKLSKHLASRLEVEKVFAEYFRECIFLRAGLILGANGSSYNILVNLVKNLPVLICPRWAQNLTSPIHISHVIDTIIEHISSVSDNQESISIINLSSKDMITYFELLVHTAKLLKKRRKFYSISIPILSVSRLWVSFFSGASRRLVYPLLESLKHPMVPGPSDKVSRSDLSVVKSLELVSKETPLKPYQFSNYIHHESFVRSVQRAYLPDGLTAKDAAHEYMIWLPRFLYPFIIVSVEDDWVTFSFLFASIKLLILQRIQGATSDFQSFRIRGGLLALKHDKGRLEFREVLGESTLLMSIHDFYPSLPWYIYRYTQAIFHLFVMNSFRKYLRKLGS